MQRFDSVTAWWDKFMSGSDAAPGGASADAVPLMPDGTFGTPFTCRIITHGSASVTAKRPEPGGTIEFYLDPLVTTAALTSSKSPDRQIRVLLFTGPADMAEFIKSAQLRTYLKNNRAYLAERADSLRLTAAIECLRGNVAPRDIKAMLAAAERDMDASEQAGRPVRPQIDYTVCFLFTPDLEQVLLQTKAKTDFKGELNGVGGKLEPDEPPEACAAREIKEETGLDRIRGLRWIGTLELPDNCDNHAVAHDPMAPACRLYYYAGVFDPAGLAPPEGSEALSLHDVDALVAAPVTQPGLAGHGDLQYFVLRAHEALSAEMRRNADMRERRDAYPAHRANG